MSLQHDTVYGMKIDGETTIGGSDLASITYTTEQATGCNGVWAISYVARSRKQAVHMAQEMLRGGLPAGIKDGNDYTRRWRLAQIRAARKDQYVGRFDVREIEELERLAEQGDSCALAELAALES